MAAEKVLADLKQVQDRLVLLQDEAKGGHMDYGFVTFKSIKLVQEIANLEKQKKELQRVLKSKLNELDDSEPPAKVARVEKIVCKCGCRDLVERDGLMVCIDCGATNITDRTFDSSPAFSESGISKRTGYAPQNHFAEILAQFQGKRRAYPPKDVVDLVKKYCDDYSIPLEDVTPMVVRKMLRRIQHDDDVTNRQRKLEQRQNRKSERAERTKKRDNAYCIKSIEVLKNFQCKKGGPVKPLYKKRKLKRRREQTTEETPRVARKYTDFYKYAVEISKILSGNIMPGLSPSQETKVKALFISAVAAYPMSRRYYTRKKNRGNRQKEVPNTQNYFYILYKILHMLGYEKLLAYIPLPKSLANIRDNDENGWKFICEQNHWPYYPTV
jgi:hypothetical protein